MSGSATNQNGPVGHTGSFNFRGSLAAATAGRRRPQATAGDRRRPQATAGEQARAQQQKRRLDYMGLKRHPALSQRLGTSRTSERRRWAEASGDRAKAAQRSAGRMTGAMATSRFTPPGATAPTQSNNAARRGAASGAARAAGPHNKPRASHPEKARRVLAGCGGKTHQLRPAVRHQHCRALATISRAGSARANASRDPARLMIPLGNRCSPLSGAGKCQRKSQNEPSNETNERYAAAASALERANRA